jgi:hypothetical protein
MNPPASANIALTYANDKLMDGLGAQLQRVYGIYAISRFLKLPYVHSPLKKIGYQGLSALENNSATAELESQCNRIFAIASDLELPRDRIVYEATDAELPHIKRLQIAAQTTGKFTLLRILLPYTVTDRIPEIYRHAKAVSPFRRTRSEVFRLAIHVRRGELFLIESARMLPNSYYVSCALRFAGRLQELNIPFVCEIYTEVPSRAFVVTPEHHGIDGKIPANVTIDPQVNRLEDFDVLPNLVKFINGDPIETLGRLATADGLVLSRSSYSYVAAILNANCIVVYHPFWHSPVQEWLTSDANGMVPDADLTTRLECWKRERSESKLD